MKIYVTGVAGFLGSHVADYFLAQGHEVSGCDNFIGGEVENIPEGCRFEFGDCCDRDDIPFIRDGGDVLFHCAATAYEGLSVFSPSFVTRNIGAASIAVFSAAIEAGFRRIVFCSSMARYGSGSVPFTEGQPTSPVDPYGTAKVYAEQVLRQLCETHGVEYVIACPHNILGPRQKYDDPYRNVASIFINRMLQDKQPIIYGDGRSSRCFSYVDDCISCLAAMTDCPEGTYNIGPDEGFITINKLAEEIADILNFDLDPIYVPGRPREVKLAFCSSDKARAYLGYETKTSLREGLEELCWWIDERGPREFDYHLPLEIVNDKTPRTWVDRMI